MATPLARRPAADGASPQVVAAASGTAGYAVPASLRGIRQAAALIAETIGVVAAAIFLFLRAVLAGTAPAGSGRPAGPGGRG